MTNHDQFDELLDHALSEYREAEPLTGLDDRVLQRLQSQPVERRHAWWMWGAIATCAALLLIGVWIGVENPTPPKEGGVGHRASPPVSSPESKEFVRVTKRPTRPKEGRMGHPALVARTETVTSNVTATSRFPTPAPLTAEEHALLAMFRANPDAAPKPGENSDDTTIAPLEIEPLAGSAAPTEENSNE